MYSVLSTVYNSYDTHAYARNRQRPHTSELLLLELDRPEHVGAALEARAGNIRRSLLFLFLIDEQAGGKRAGGSGGSPTSKEDLVLRWRLLPPPPTAHATSPNR